MTAPGESEDGGSGPQLQDRLQATPPRQLIIAAVVGAIGAWLLASTAELITGMPLQLPWAGPLVLLIIGAFVVALAIGTWLRLQRDHRYIDPQRAVMLLALGKAAALAGALLAGGYLTFGLLSFGAADAPSPRDRVIRSVVAAIGGIVIMAGGLLLERACRVQRDDDDSASDLEI